MDKLNWLIRPVAGKAVRQPRIGKQQHPRLWLKVDHVASKGRLGCILLGPRDQRFTGSRIMEDHPRGVLRTL